jgi:hypothetical protein
VGESARLFRRTGRGRQMAAVDRPTGRPEDRRSGGSPGSWSCKLACERSCICRAPSAVAPASDAVAASHEGDQPQLPWPGKRGATARRRSTVRLSRAKLRGFSMRRRSMQAHPPPTWLDARVPRATIATTSFSLSQAVRPRPTSHSSLAGEHPSRSQPPQPGPVSLCLPRVEMISRGARCSRERPSRSILASIARAHVPGLPSRAPTPHKPHGGERFRANFASSDASESRFPRPPKGGSRTAATRHLRLRAGP